MEVADPGNLDQGMGDLAGWLSGEVAQFRVEMPVRQYVAPAGTQMISTRRLAAPAPA